MVYRTYCIALYHSQKRRHVIKLFLVHMNLYPTGLGAGAGTHRAGIVTTFPLNALDVTPFYFDFTIVLLNSNNNVLSTK